MVSNLFRRLIPKMRFFYFLSCVPILIAYPLVTFSMQELYYAYPILCILQSGLKKLIFKVDGVFLLAPQENQGPGVQSISVSAHSFVMQPSFSARVVISSRLHGQLSISPASSTKKLNAVSHSAVGRPNFCYTPFTFRYTLMWNYLNQEFNSLSFI